MLRTIDITLMLSMSMDWDTAKALAERMTKYVKQDVKECADKNYNDDDIRLAIGRYFRDKLKIEEL